MRVRDESGQVRRRAARTAGRAVGGACLLLAVAALAGCGDAGGVRASASTPGAEVTAGPSSAPGTEGGSAGPGAPAADSAFAAAGTRAVALGYEDVADPDVDLDAVAHALDAIGADTVALSAGRADWTTFRWADNEHRWSTHTGSGTRDPFTRAAATLGEDRAVVAVVDVFATGYLSDNPEAAAEDGDGAASDFQVSIVELTQGAHGDALVAMVGELAARDDVDAVSLTELHYDDAGLGADDEAAFAADTGSEGWPRDDDGEIDWRDAEVAAWRSERVAGFVARAADAAHAGGAELLVDVRSPRQGGTGIHGQDYALLLEHADRLVIWYYPGLASGDGSAYPVERVAEEVRDLGDAGGLDRFVLSVGLWDADDEVLEADALREALDEAADAGFARTWITPWSLMDEAHEEAAAGAWE